jgi:hypothetical protein
LATLPLVEPWFVELFVGDDALLVEEVLLLFVWVPPLLEDIAAVVAGCGELHTHMSESMDNAPLLVSDKSEYRDLLVFGLN